MKLELRGVRKGSARTPALPPTNARVSDGEAVLVEAETEQRPTVLGLIASGRMRPDGGDVLVDGRRNAALLRKRSALVDAPDVSDHDPNVLTIGVVQEELMYAGRPSGPVAAKQWLKDRGFGDLALQAIGTVRPSVRIRMLCALAAERPGVDTLVLVSPDRHGGRPQDWWVVAEDFAARGFAVLVIAGRASWQVIVGPDDIPDLPPASGAVPDADVDASFPTPGTFPVPGTSPTPDTSPVPRTSPTPGTSPVDAPADAVPAPDDLSRTPPTPAHPRRIAEISPIPAPAPVVSEADVEISAIRRGAGASDRLAPSSPTQTTDNPHATTDNPDTTTDNPDTTTDNPHATTDNPDATVAAGTPAGEDAR